MSPKPFRLQLSYVAIDASGTLSETKRGVSRCACKRRVLLSWTARP